MDSGSPTGLLDERILHFHGSGIALKPVGADAQGAAATRPQLVQTQERGATMVDALRRQAAAFPSRRAFTFLSDGEQETATLSFGELDRGARAVAARLQGLGAGGGRAILLYPAGLDFVVAFYGCMYAGVTPVPVSLPNRQRGLALLGAIVNDCRPRCLLSSAALLARLKADLCGDQALSALLPLATDTWDTTLGTDCALPRVLPEQLALLQYTSGSTGTPRGVCVTHASLVHNQRLIVDHFGNDEHSTLVSWLPMFHDMGLGSALLHAVWLGVHCVLMPPSAFVQKPVRWLQALSRYRGTFSAAPDFAYDLCARRIGPELCAGLDLSCWRAACNGSEPVRAATLRRFAEVFAPYGFDARALRPAYGLAEATLIVTAHARGVAPRVLAFAPEALEQGFAVPGSDVEGRSLVSCGPPLLDTRLSIVDPLSLDPCPPGRIGEVWVSNLSVASGYYHREAENPATFAASTRQGDGPFLRTGDLGFIHDGELFITGRLKDLIILRGRNHYPQDIEASVAQCHAALERDRCAAFSVEMDGSERLIVVQEVKRTALRNLQSAPIVAAITRAVARDHGVAVHAVDLIRPSTLSRTSSGKIQRKACRLAYLGGTLDSVARWEAKLEGTHATDPEAADTAHGTEPLRPSRRELRAWLAAWLSARLQLAEPSIDGQRSLADSGLDSVGSVELVRDLSLKLGRPLDETTLWSFPSIDALVARYAGPRPSPSPPDTAMPPSASASAEEAIAIVGVGCRFPGGVTDVESFWRLLRDGVDAVSEVPPERWDIDAWYAADPDAPGKMSSRWGGFVRGIEHFDAHFFGISPQEARSVDPQQRLLLETSWEALEHAGIVPAQLMGSNTGVYMGLCGSEYNARLLANQGQLGPYTLLGSMHSTMVGRLSYWLGLCGPNLPVDTACSSSLVAVHLACQALRQGEVNLALAGGANVLLDPAASVCFSQLRATSPTGRCRSFSADADGYVRAEGAGVVILERLSDAQKLGHRVLCVIRASAVNQDGRSNGPTAPNGLSQQAVLREALRRAALPPEAVGYVECHGTGTPLGDPIEVQALGAVFARTSARRRPLVIGSLKTNLGHMEGAAGIGGLIKAALIVNRAQIPQSLHFAAPNPHIPWHELAVQVAAQPLDWPDDGAPRIAGVSSFGISGTNAHILVEQPPALPPPAAPQRSAEVCVLSARTPQALRDSAQRLRRHLLDHPQLSLRDVAYTLSLRALLEHRLTLPVRSLEHLIDALERYDSSASQEPEDAAESVPTLAPFPDSGCRLDLPTYPWQRQRYWLEPQPLRAPTPRDELAALLRQLTERTPLSEAARLGMAEVLATLTASPGETATEAPSDPVSGAARAALEAEVAGLRKARSPRDVLCWLTRRCALLLGENDPDSLDVQRGFFDIGLDSLKLTELHREVVLALGKSLLDSTLFTHPNLSALAQLLWRELHATEDRMTEPSAKRQLARRAPDLASEATTEELARYIDSRG